MALSFTNEQIKTITADIIALPKIIDFPLDPETGEGGTGLVQKKEEIIKSKDSLFVTDQQNKIFSDHWTNVVSLYHEELNYITLNKREDYKSEYIDDGAQLKEPHYDMSHAELTPMVIPSNNGLPVIPSSGLENETHILDRLDDAIDIYVNGKSGSSSDTLDGTWTNNQPVSVVEGTSFSIGEKVFMIQGGNIMIAEVVSSGGSCTGETPEGSGVDESSCTSGGGTWSNTLTLKAVSEEKPFSAGAVVQNYSPAFSNSVRGRQSASPNYPLQLFLEDEVETQFNNMAIYLDTIRLCVRSNDDTNGIRKTNNIEYINVLNAKIDEYSVWASSEITSPDGRYTDAKMPVLQSSQNEMRTINPDRGTQVVEMLGSVTDNGGGDIVGDGVYFDLWKFIVIRIAKSGGTLYAWYGADLGVMHFDTKIKNATSQLEEYTNIFDVKQLVEDADLGENEVVVENVEDLSENDSVMIFDDTTPIMESTIWEISGNRITLEQSLTSGLLVSKLARVVKEV